MRKTLRRALPLFLRLITAVEPRAQTAVEPLAEPAVIGGFELPRMALSQFKNPAVTEAALEIARSNGLLFTDLPSIGSGLTWLGGNEFAGITDRGPNGKVQETSGKLSGAHLFPLPMFNPSIIRFKLTNQAIEVIEVIPLSDGHGRLLTGLSNVEGEERLYESEDSPHPLAFDPDGVDPEGIRRFPDGRYLLSEEYSPSLLVVTANGQTQVRYTPATKPLTNATYSVKPILPAIFAQRRDNKGFESLALSKDGATAYAILQSPMGDPKNERFANGRVLRIVKLDFTDPLNARVTGEYVAETSPAGGYTRTAAETPPQQEQINWSDAEWIGPDKLLVVEKAKGEVRIVAVDLTHATNLLGGPESEHLTLEDASTELEEIGILPAETTTVLSTARVKGIDSSKIEGLAIMSRDEIALSNDNDFGIGDNIDGEPSKVWLVRIPALAKFFLKTDR